MFKIYRVDLQDGAHAFLRLNAAEPQAAIGECLHPGHAPVWRDTPFTTEDFDGEILTAVDQLFRRDPDEVPPWTEDMDAFEASIVAAAPDDPVILPPEVRAVVECADPGLPEAAEH